MAIKIAQLEEAAEQFVDTKYLYKDLRLDFSVEKRYDTAYNQTIIKNDIGVDYDIFAIRNSIKNLFGTRPGQRFLFPRYGLDLQGYLFEPITEVVSEEIRNTIIMTITDFEPRVRTTECVVIPNEDQNEYNIDLIIEILAIKTQTRIYSDLDLKSQSFKFLETRPKQRI